MFPCLRSLALLVVLSVAAPATAATFAVTSNADSGANTLRAAIAAANATPAADTITFNLAAGQRTIALASSLPTITTPLDIDGTSQPGWAGVPLVRIDGLGLPAGHSALRINGGTSTVRGLMITRTPGIGLLLDGGFGHQVWGNYIGTDGAAALGNVTGVQIGGTVALTALGQATAQRHNVVSGNTHTGVLIANEASFNTVQNNRIGTNAAGTAAIPNGHAGMRIFGHDNSIGGSAPLHANVLSGNGRFGVENGGSGNAFHGNRIGTDLAGSAALGNGESGLTDSGDDTRIGGIVDGSGNLISGNGSAGVLLVGTHTTIVGNRIGTNAAGTAAIGNGYVGIRVFGSDIDIGDAGVGNLLSGNVRYGIELGGGASQVRIRHNRIGTTADGNGALPNHDDGINTSAADVDIGGTDAGNLISGNIGSGISVSAGSQGLRVVANRIGTRADGMSALPNTHYALRAIEGDGLVLGAPGLGNLLSGNGRGVYLHAGAGPALIQSNVIGLTADQSQPLGSGEDGVTIYGAGHRIGGSGADEGNVIAANASTGIYLGAGARDNIIEGNVIGSDASGTLTAGNGYASVYVYRADGNLIGGSAAAGNVLRGSAFGVYVDLGTGNTIAGNSIAGHARAGIELTPHGPEANDPLDLDSGPNLGQNRPLPRSATQVGGDLQLSATLDAAASTDYRLEFFHSDSCHANGLGEGQHPLGALEASTGADGRVALAWTVPNPHGAGVLTATATDAAGNTSEFSPCVAIGAAGAGQFNLWHDPLLAYEDQPSVRVTVIRSLGFDGAASVRLRSVNESATAPADYAAVSQVLQFADGEWLKTLDIALVDDGDTEGNESFRLVLDQPTGGSTLGTYADAEVVLFDHEDAWPFVRVDDVQVDEADASATFTIESSGTDHAFEVTFETFDGSATAGEDYVATSGAVAFGPGIATRTVTVPLLYDGVGEGTETFGLHLSGVSGQFIADDLDGEAVILDDDGGALFRDSFE